jgi:hypothetical protein
VVVVAGNVGWSQRNVVMNNVGAQQLL